MVDLCYSVHGIFFFGRVERMSEIATAFNELFYGSGMWLGLLLLISIIIVISLKTKYAGIIMFPATVFLAINYFTELFLWGGVLMLLTGTFVILTMIKGND
jgi:hypothetical protein